MKIAVCIKQVVTREWQLRVNDQKTWIRDQDASFELNEPDAYALEEATELERLTARLNEHGFALEHTAAELFPKLERLSVFLGQPLVAATLPWLIRRALGRPYRRR